MYIFITVAKILMIRCVFVIQCSLLLMYSTIYNGWLKKLSINILTYHSICRNSTKNTVNNPCKGMCARSIIVVILHYKWYYRIKIKNTHVKQIKHNTGNTDKIFLLNQFVIKSLPFNTQNGIMHNNIFVFIKIIVILLIICCCCFFKLVLCDTKVPFGTVDIVKLCYEKHLCMVNNNLCW